MRVSVHRSPPWNEVWRRIAPGRSNCPGFAAQLKGVLVELQGTRAASPEMTALGRSQQHNCQGRPPGLKSAAPNLPLTGLAMPCDMTDLRDRPAEPSAGERLDS